MERFIVYFVVFGIPALAGLIFFLCLFLWLRIRSRYRDDPASVPESKVTRSKNMAILFGIVFGIIAFVWGGMAILLFIGLSHM